MKKSTHLTIAIAAAILIIMLLDLYSLKHEQSSANATTNTIGYQQEKNQ